MTNEPSTTSKGMIMTLVLMTITGAIAVDVSIPVLTEVASEFGLKASSGQLIISAFLIGYAIGQIPGGLLGDRLGRLPIIYAGFILYTLAGFMTAWASSMEIILIARFFQGIGASIGTVLGRATIRDISKGKELARNMSLIVTVLGVGTLLAPIIGSALVAIWSWKATFMVSPFLGIVILLLMPFFMYETLDKSHAQKNIVQQLRYSISSFLSSPQSIWGTLITALAFAGYMNLLASTSNIIVDIYGYPATYVGSIFGLACLSYVAGAFINRKLVTQYGTLKMLGVAMFIYGISSLLLAWVTWKGSIDIVPLWIILSIYLSGLGFMLPNAAAITIDPLPKSAGFAASILGTTQIGVAAGVTAYTSTLYQSTITTTTGVIATSGILAVLVFLIGKRIILK